jgi:lipoprotein-releasing system permease protein
VRLDLFLALRFLREGRGQSGLIVGGAAVGVAVVVFLSALIGAVQRQIIAQTLDVLPHIVVRMPDERTREVGPAEGVSFAAVDQPAQRVHSVEQWPAIQRALEELPGVVASSPTVTGPAFASRGTASRSVTLLGVEPERFAKVITILPRIKRGQLRLGGNDVVVGVELAKELGVKLGDPVRISTAGGAEGALTIAGIFDLGNRDVNRRWVLVSLRNGQAMLGLPGGASEINLRIKDFWQADKLAGRIDGLTGLHAESWMTTSQQLLIALNSQSSSSSTIQFFIILAVAIGIASVLAVSVVQKSRQIGILRAMGMSRAMVLRVFLIQGGAVGVLGGVIGSAFGTLLLFGFESGARNADGSPTYPVEYGLSLYGTAFALAVITGLVASALPARRASRLDPVEAIRHE